MKRLVGWGAAALAWVLPVAGFGVENPPSACGAGNPPFKFAVQVSLDAGGTWINDAGTVFGRPGQQVSVMARTLMTVTSGQTQGWSFSLEYDDSNLLYYSGSIAMTAVTTAGTQTATVQNGLPPDTDETKIRPGYKGYTQGVLIDNDQVITLGPTTSFVTSKACYRITLPSHSGSYSAYLKFTHAIGNPNIRTVITQAGLSNVPCVKNFTLNLSVNPYGSATPGGCSIPGGGYAPQGGPQQGGPELDGAAQGGAEPCVLFQRGDSTDDGILNITDPIFTLTFLFRGGAAPDCTKALDANDDGRSDISDAVYTLSFLFTGGPAPPPPHGICGPDPTADTSSALCTTPAATAPACRRPCSLRCLSPSSCPRRWRPRTCRSGTSMGTRTSTASSPSRGERTASRTMSTTTS